MAQYTTHFVDEKNRGYAPNMEFPELDSIEKIWSNEETVNGLSVSLIPPNPHIFNFSHDGQSYIAQTVEYKSPVFQGSQTIWTKLRILNSETGETVKEATVNGYGKNLNKYLSKGFFWFENSIIYKNGFIYCAYFEEVPAFSFPSERTIYRIGIRKISVVDPEILVYTEGYMYSIYHPSYFGGSALPSNAYKSTYFQNVSLGIDDSGQILVTSLLTTNVLKTRSGNIRYHEITTNILCHSFNSGLTLISSFDKSIIKNTTESSFSYVTNADGSSKGIYCFENNQKILFINNVFDGLDSYFAKCDFENSNITLIIKSNNISPLISSYYKYYGAETTSNLIINNSMLHFVGNNFVAEENNNYLEYKKTIYLYSYDFNGNLISKHKINSDIAEKGSSLKNKQRGFDLNFNSLLHQKPCQLIQENDSLYVISEAIFNKTYIKYPNIINPYSFEGNAKIGLRAIDKINFDGSVIFSKSYYDVFWINSSTAPTLLFSLPKYATVNDDFLYMLITSGSQEGYDNFGTSREDLTTFDTSVATDISLGGRLNYVAKIDKNSGNILSFKMYKEYQTIGLKPHMSILPYSDGSRIILLDNGEYLGKSTSLISAYGVSSDENSSSSTSSESSSNLGSETSEESAVEEISSSSSFDDPIYIDETSSLKIWGVLLHQGHHNLLPFKFKTNEGLENLDQSEAITIAALTPDNEENYYSHKPTIYIDVLTQNAEGVKKTYVSNQNLSSEATALDSYQIPKFTWDNSLIIATRESTKQVKLFDYSCWIGNSDGLNKVLFSDKEIEIQFQQSIDESLKSVWSSETSRILTTSNEYLFAHNLNHYINQFSQYDMEFEENNKKFNASQELILFQDANYTFTSQGKHGIVTQRENGTLDVVNIFSGLDSIFKIFYSSYNDYYVLVGDKFLWKLDDNVTTIIYSIDNVSIVDVVETKKGYLGIIFRGEENDLLRVLAPNHYSISYNENFALETLHSLVVAKNELIALQNGTTTPINYKFVKWSETGVSEHIFVPEVKESLSSASKTTTTSTIEILFPNEEDVTLNKEKIITWLSTKSKNDLVTIELLSENDDIISTLAENYNNSGSFTWIPTELEIGSNYKIKITWLSANEDASNYDTSDVFKIVDSSSAQNTSAVAQMDWDERTNSIILITQNGYLGYINLNTMIFVGLIDTKIENVHSLVAINERIYISDNQSKVRLFVGSQEYLSDMWDSGEVSGDLTSMYYGGGNNLIPGEKYYVHVQIYTPEWGWSKVQKTTFIMPR